MEPCTFVITLVCGFWSTFQFVCTGCSKEVAVVKLCKDSKATPPVCILGPVDRVPAPAQPSVGGNEESVIADC